MKRLDLIRQLEQNGCLLIRHGGRHDWYQGENDVGVKSRHSILLQNPLVPNVNFSPGQLELARLQDSPAFARACFRFSAAFACRFPRFPDR
jgi:hypothetical protein